MKFGMKKQEIYSTYTDSVPLLKKILIIKQLII